MHTANMRNGKQYNLYIARRSYWTVSKINISAPTIERINCSHLQMTICINITTSFDEMTMESQTHLGVSPIFISEKHYIAALCAIKFIVASC